MAKQIVKCKRVTRDEGGLLTMHHQTLSRWLTATRGATHIQFVEPLLGWGPWVALYLVEYGPEHAHLWAVDGPID